jgi:hypothetical protein
MKVAVAPRVTAWLVAAFSLLVAVGRSEAAPLEAAPPAPGSYPALVAEAVASAQAGRLAEARTALDRAVAAEPSRAEAYVERGGLHFLEERYGEAARDLERALDLREDAHARELLAASLHLLGREDEALASWNRLGRPTVARMEITGLQHTKDAVARRELRFGEGGRLDLDAVRESRRRLAETGAFERVSLHTHPKGDGTADVEVALLERHGLAQDRTELAATTLAQLADRRLGLRYANVGGRGVAVFGSWRFAPNRPELALGFDWPRPFGLDANLRGLARRGRQAFAFEDPVERRSRGLDVALRRVLGANTTGELAFSFRDREFSNPTPEAPPGLVAGAQLGVERRLLERGPHRLDATVRAFTSRTALGADFDFVRGIVTLRYERGLGLGRGGSVAARALGGWASDGLPLDEGFLPGGGPESAFPLRAHRQFPDGIAGGMALGRSILLGNVEWRQDLLVVGPLRLGTAFFYDGGRTWRGGGSVPWQHDSGVGVRVAFQSSIIRIDYAHGWVDGSNALTLGLGHAF